MQIQAKLVIIQNIRLHIDGVLIIGTAVLIFRSEMSCYFYNRMHSVYVYFPDICSDYVVSHRFLCVSFFPLYIPM